jgi:hypothetical protein
MLAIEQIVIIRIQINLMMIIIPDNNNNNNNFIDVMFNMKIIYICNMFVVQKFYLFSI